MQLKFATLLTIYGSVVGKLSLLTIIVGSAGQISHECKKG